MKINKLITLLKSKKGLSTPLAVVLVLIILMFTSVIFQFVKSQIIISGVRNAVQSAIISVTTENYYTVYNSARQGYSGSYRYVSAWKQVVKKGDIYTKLDNLLGTAESGGKHSKNGEFSVYGLTVTAVNPVIAPISDAPQLEISATITVEIPIVYCGEILPPITVNLEVNSVYMPKF